jgi:hypothetical protein
MAIPSVTAHEGFLEDSLRGIRFASSNSACWNLGRLIEYRSACIVLRELFNRGGKPVFSTFCLPAEAPWMRAWVGHIVHNCELEMRSSQYEV